MTGLLAALLARGGAAPSTPAPAPVVSDPEAASVPYAIPTTGEHRAPQYAITPTPDGTGSGLHPSVIDFYPGTFSGHRYWMAFTGWYQQQDPLENPSILCSDDAFNWAPPPGLINPIDNPWASGNSHLSDTELTFDPDTGRLWCIYRGNNYDGTGEYIWAKSTLDGVTWTERRLLIKEDADTTAAASPSIVRLAANAWVLFTNVEKWTAPAVDGPWTRGPRLVLAGSNTIVWHHAVIWTGTRFWALMDRGRGPLFPAASRDGITWHTGPGIMTRTGSGAWDGGDLYRATLRMHPEGGKVRVWYSANAAAEPLLSEQSWRIGYTHIPAKHWTDLGG